MLKATLAAKRTTGLSALAGALLLAAAPALAAPVDFDAAMTSLRFKPEKVDANLDASGKANGLLDADEMALAAAVLNDPTLDLQAKGGVRHAEVAAAFATAETSATTDLARLVKTWPQAPRVAAGYALLGEGSFAAFSKMSSGFGAPLKSDYASAVALGRFFAPDGDADGDGVSNRVEHAAFIGQGRAAYIQAALDPAVRPQKTSAVQQAPPQAPKRLKVGVLLYPGFEVLDVFGPVEMWANVPEFEVVMIAERAGPVRSAQGVDVVATQAIADAPAFDILLTPGGAGTVDELENPRLLAFLKAQDRTVSYMTSVCTGSALLAKAGVLDGRRATSNKAFFSLAESQGPKVAWVRRARWVEDGKYFTSSGVSAGTDMALGLIARVYGQDRARALAKSLEYQWSESPDDDPFALAESAAR